MDHGVKAISLHAIERWRQRSGCKKGDDNVARRLFSMLDRSVPVDLKPEFRLKELLNHNFQAARYFRLYEWVFVVVGDCLKTVHKDEFHRLSH